MGPNLLPYPGLIMGVSSLRLEPRSRGVFLCHPGGVFRSACSPHPVPFAKPRMDGRTAGSAPASLNPHAFREPTLAGLVVALAYRAGRGHGSCADRRRRRASAGIGRGHHCGAGTRNIDGGHGRAGVGAGAGAPGYRPPFHRHRIAAGPGSRPATGQGHQRSKTETARALHHRPGGDRRHAGIVCRAFWFPPQAVHAPGSRRRRWAISWPPRNCGEG